MAYQALYRTYRPQLFSEVVGQQAVVKTLQNAIINGSVSHAYLFCGPRGTGKTSVARIFAKGLNCAHCIQGEPCNDCLTCTEISQSINPDVVEIDAASNNGVDEIRNIKEKVKFLPSGAKYKIYIIDEVHMLSGGAFNALLKTLEEPPKHVIFILATTEPQKIPATIVSRCQKFDFKLLGLFEMGLKIKEICTKEEATITEEAVNLIAEVANGSLRDALSILDQVMSYGNKDIDVDTVNIVTGTINIDKLLLLMDYINTKNINVALETAGEFLESGKDASKVIESMLMIGRDILLYKSVSENGYDKYIFEKAKFKEIANAMSNAKVLYYIEQLYDAQTKVKYSTTPNVYLEVTIIRMSNVSSSDIDIMQRIKDLEDRVENVNSVPQNASQNNDVNNEKLNMLEVKVNQIVSELNKFELPKLVQKINNLGENINAKTQDVDSVDDSEITSIKSQIEDLKQQIKTLNVPYHNTEDSEKNQDKKLLDLEEKIQEVTNKIDDINEVTPVNESETTKIPGGDISDLNARINTLESKLYMLIADGLSPTSKAKSKTKVAEGQIMLFGGEVFGLNDLNKNVKEKADFDDLSKIDQPSKDSSFTEAESNDTQVFVLEKLESLKEENDLLDKSSQDIIEKEELQDTKKEEIKLEKKDTGLFSVPGESQSFLNYMESKKEEKVDAKTEQNVVPEKASVVTEPVTEPAPKKAKEEIIESFFDVQSKEQITKKINSSLSIKQKEEETPEDISNSIVQHARLDNQTTSNNVIDKKEEEQEEIIVSQKPKKEEDKFSKYDIKDLEQLLYDSQSPEARNDKARIMNIWNVLERDIEPQQLSIAELLKSGQIKAVGDKEIVIVFPNVTLCNQAMRANFKRSAIKFLYDKFGEIYNYIAIPSTTWQEKRTEYANQYCIGVKRPALTPFKIPGLSIITEEQEYINKRDKTIRQTMEEFGSNIVKVEQ